MPLVASNALVIGLPAGLPVFNRSSHPTHHSHHHHPANNNNNNNNNNNLHKTNVTDTTDSGVVNTTVASEVEGGDGDDGIPVPTENNDDSNNNEGMSAASHEPSPSQPLTHTPSQQKLFAMSMSDSVVSTSVASSKSMQQPGQGQGLPPGPGLGQGVVYGPGTGLGQDSVVSTSVTSTHSRQGSGSNQGVGVGVGMGVNYGDDFGTPHVGFGPLDADSSSIHTFNPFFSTPSNTTTIIGGHDANQSHQHHPHPHLQHLGIANQQQQHHHQQQQYHPVTLQRRQAESYLKAVSRAQTAGEHGEYGRAKRILRQQEEDKKAMMRVMRGLGQAPGPGLAPSSGLTQRGSTAGSGVGLGVSHALAPSSTTPTSSSTLAGLLSPLFVAPPTTNNQGSSLGSPTSKNYTISRHPAYLDKNLTHTRLAMVGHTTYGGPYKPALPGVMTATVVVPIGEHIRSVSPHRLKVMQ